MKLSVLLSEFLRAPLNIDPVVEGLTVDTRKLIPGDVFIAKIGSHKDGRQFIDEAIHKGAVAVLTDGPEMAVNWQGNVSIITIPHLIKNHLSDIAAKFFGYPTKHLTLIGVTGTSGKTSCTQFIAGSLYQLGIPCGVIGTLGNGLYGSIEPGELTTPDAITLQKWFAYFVAKGVKIVTMEVSSHSLDQGRVAGLLFDIAIFTNLSRDHLDYHHSMEAYGEAKKKLFYQAKKAIINSDDPFGVELLRQLTQEINEIQLTEIYSFGMNLFKDQKPDIYAEHIELDAKGIKAEVVSSFGTGVLKSGLMGKFNISNLLAALGALALLDIVFERVVTVLSTQTAVLGRMQTFGGYGRPLVVVDYAHKPDALEKVLIALRTHTSGKLFCIFGCGGDRDKGKRPLMAKIAETYSDQVILTDDNPRHEDPKLIVEDILGGFSHPEKIIVEHDRSKAIQNVIHYAKEGDCVLIAGKGAETYQQIGDEKIPFNDLEKVREILGC